MTLPNTLIIGAQKGGSTWLYELFKKHEQIFVPERVELLHFNKVNCNDEDMKVKYSSHFESVTNEKIIAEKTPSYLWTFDSSTNEKLFSPGHNRNIVTDCKNQLGDNINIISSLRHPVTRSISAFYHHAKRNRIESSSTFNGNFYKYGMVDLGFYGRHLNNWMLEFSKDNFLTLIMERDIIDDPSNGCRLLSKFLGVSDFTKEHLPGKSSNKGVKTIITESCITSTLNNSPFIKSSELKQLLDLYCDDMNLLRETIEDDLDEWRDIDKEITRFATVKVSVSEKIEPENAKAYGLEVPVNKASKISKHASFESPLKLSQVAVNHNSNIGAFTYFTEGSLFNVDVGRYCSFAKNVNVGQSNHPTNWLSTSPFQYEPNFKFSVEDIDDIDYLPASQEMRSKALQAIRKPKTKIGHDVWVGHGAIINAGVKIGNGAIVGAGSVVTKDVPDFSIVAGVPAKVIKFRFDEKIISKLTKLQWWNYAPWQLEGISFDCIDSAIEKIAKLKTTYRIMPYYGNRYTFK